VHVSYTTPWKLDGKITYVIISCVMTILQTSVESLTCETAWWVMLVCDMSTGEQAATGRLHSEDIQPDRRPDVHLWHAGEANPRVQATAAQHPAHHHHLQPTQVKPKHAICGTHCLDGWQGNTSSGTTLPRHTHYIYPSIA